MGYRRPRRAQTVAPMSQSLRVLVLHPAPAGFFLFPRLFTNTRRAMTLIQRGAATNRGPSIKHRVQARFDAVARRPRTRQPDDPAIRGRVRPHFGAVEALPLATRRVASVDALRGFTMFWIIGADGATKALAEMLSGKGTILSTAGKIIGEQFEHAEWEGLRFYDLIFPLFIFVTGVAIVFSLTRLVEPESKSTAHWRVLRRSLLLFALGVVYGGVSESWSDIRLLGVLNRIALCYLFTSLLFLNLRLPGLIVAIVAILAGYWALMTFVPVSGIGVGSYVKDANLANWIDAQYLPGRKWNGAWDPEGLLSTLPAIGTCLLGVFAGLLLKEPILQPHQKTLWLIGAGRDDRARSALGAAVPDRQEHLDVLVRARVRRIERAAARRVSSSHRCVGAEELGHDLHLDWGKRDHALPHQRHRGLQAARNAAGWRRRGQLCGQPSDARLGELSRPCRGAAASGGNGRLPIPPQDLSARVTCAGSCLIVSVPDAPPDPSWTVRRKPFPD